MRAMRHECSSLNQVSKNEGLSMNLRENFKGEVEGIISFLRFRMRMPLTSVRLDPSEASVG